jgi:hypothetical protein
VFVHKNYALKSGGSQMTAHIDVSAARRRLRRVAMVWWVLAVAVTGGLVGWLTGLSESPIAGIALPLLFALIAGAGGFHFAASRNSWSSMRGVAQANVVFLMFASLNVL